MNKTIILISVIVFIATSLIAYFILQDFPNSADEYCYIYQAKTLCSGKFYNDAHPLQKMLSCVLIATKEGKTFSVFPPGWPLMLCIALFVKLPLFLLNPILGALGLGVLFLIAKELFDERVGFITIATLLASSFFLFNSASFFSHALCALLIYCAVYCGILLLKTEKNLYAFLIGLFGGFAFITRYYTTMLCFIPLLVYIVANKPKLIKKIIWPILGAIPFIVFLALQNYSITGNVLTLPVSWVGLREYGCGFIWGEGFLFQKGGLYLASHLLDFVIWTPPLLLLIYILTMPRYLLMLKSPKFLCSAMFLIVIIGYFGFGVYGGNQYGARFYYEPYGFFLIFIVSEVFQKKEAPNNKIFKKIIYYIFLLSILASIALSVWHLKKEHNVVWERKDIYRTIKEERIDDAIIFIASAIGPERQYGFLEPEQMFPGDLIRNDFESNDTVLITLFRGKYDKLLMAYYPDRNYYIYMYNDEKKSGKLVPYNKQSVSK